MGVHFLLLVVFKSLVEVFCKLDRMVHPSWLGNESIACLAQLGRVGEKGGMFYFVFRELGLRTESSPRYSDPLDSNLIL